MCLKQPLQFQCGFTVLPVDLTLRDDNLARVDVAGVGNGMVQDADGPDHLADFGGALHNVAGVADELFALGKLEQANIFIYNFCLW